ncbi:NADPH:quinone oxidoreductase family protein [Citricoccus sp. I39-566]|uniref:NADPH:quinone oxidoreductase family protein n=1 Tax=Citricoccus sp. I39-566 TaxID=3073268 RepID=UPI00286C4376|nr:NADPH:quinone oxidoreductase family protein [Citricoccus sp. I39-566]WMY78901.1 NADPH:quinone oxidoreductase family protein [Citricoccus sp. I39-566]
MKAALVKEFGPPSSVVFGEAEDPTPGPDEVVIDVVATSVNFPDLLVVEGTYQNLPERPFSPGKEAAGRIASIGANVSGFTVGDRVLALVEYGTYAEKVVSPASQVIGLPDGVDFVRAASFGLIYTTAWAGLVRRGGITSSDVVLVTGAGGGVGSAGVDLAKAHGATIIALAKDEERANLALSQGADHALTSLPETLRDDVLALTEGHGVDLTLESLGGDYLSQIIRCTAWEGRVVITGFASGGQNPIKPGHLLVKNISVMGLQASDYRDRTPDLVQSSTVEMLEMVARGVLNPPVDRTYPLAEAAAALQHVKNGKVRGKIVMVTRNLRDSDSLPDGVAAPEATP